jgi:hypothetical protein
MGRDQESNRFRHEAVPGPLGVTSSSSLDKATVHHLLPAQPCCSFFTSKSHINGHCRTCDRHEIALGSSFEAFDDELNLSWVESPNPRSRLSMLLSKVLIRPVCAHHRARLRSWRAGDAGSDAVDRPINHPFAPENGHNDYASYGTRRMTRRRMLW